MHYQGEADPRLFLQPLFLAVFGPLGGGMQVRRGFPALSFHQRCPLEAACQGISAPTGASRERLKPKTGLQFPPSKHN